MVAGSGGSEAFCGRDWLVALALPADERDVFVAEFAPPDWRELFGERVCVRCWPCLSPPQLNQLGRNERLDFADESAKCVEAGDTMWWARPAAGSIASRDQPGRKPLVPPPSATEGWTLVWAIVAPVNSVPRTRPLATEFQ
jgi:hypothetical protein